MISVQFCNHPHIVNFTLWFCSCECKKLLNIFCSRNGDKSKNDTCFSADVYMSSCEVLAG